jgi:hypothetical protein
MCIINYMTKYNQLFPDFTVILCLMLKAPKALQWYLDFKEGIYTQPLIQIVLNKVH